MARIKIKIQELFNRLGYSDKKFPGNEISFISKHNIKIKDYKDQFVDIKEFVMKRCDSYKYLFENGLTLICSDMHKIKTSDGIKNMKDISSSEIIECKEKTRLVNYNLHKKSDILYDFCLDYPHLFKDSNGFIHHNSLVISYIIKTLIENNKSHMAIIIVPNKSLVEQFYNDMHEYGMSKLFSIGRVYAKYKEWEEDVVIATWQTLMNNHDKLKLYDCVIVDECHGVKSHQLKKILINATKAKYRLGFTGTLHAGQLDTLNTYSYLGPLLADYSSGELAEQGYISKCNIKIINIEYQQEFEGTYDEVKDAVFTNTYRLNTIKSILNKADHNVLLLVGKVEKEGDYLKNWLQDVVKKEVIFISGRDGVDEREKWRKACMERKDIVIIATYSIFSTGINIPNLKYVILGSPFMSKIRVLQSIGRSLRKHADKKDGSIVYDIHDHTKYLHKHGNMRYRYFSSEGFDIEEFKLEEGDTISI